ncbi:hypothetical protein KP509_20G013600 [Ceratopteris richardii]|uniref:RING-type domain-containing protein n=1 Tax=Ceratopteris richardii TaxID=49495 RepID=A0A8T2SFA6_CERRI|nr:hypothetical protein KP509_20G013600 [Ceratopteris richardii]
MDGEVRRVSLGYGILILIVCVMFLLSVCAGKLFGWIRQRASRMLAKRRWQAQCLENRKIGSRNQFSAKLSSMTTEKLEDEGIWCKWVQPSAMERPLLNFTMPAATAMAVTVKEEEEEECCICMETMMVEGGSGEQELRLLPMCGHVFHGVCLDAWLPAHSSCPLCRTTFSSSFPLTLPSAV